MRFCIVEQNITYHRAEIKNQLIFTKSIKPIDNNKRTFMRMQTKKRLFSTNVPLLVPNSP